MQIIDSYEYKTTIVSDTLHTMHNAYCGAIPQDHPTTSSPSTPGQQLFADTSEDNAPAGKIHFQRA